ncbi:MAG: lytic transglycosylase domain-containing protein [Salinisphaeraceae bacterium]
MDLPPCVDQIAVVYQVPVEIIAAIRIVEGGRPGLVVTNRSGSQDLGPMQINTWWIEHLDEWGIDRNDLLHNPCTNIATGAWIFRQEYDRFGNLPDAFAAYNAGAGNLAAGRQYAERAQKVLEKVWLDRSEGTIRVHMEYR